MITEARQRPTAEQVAHSFLQPRPPARPLVRDFIPGAQRVEFDVPGGTLGGISAGSGPRVLLQHGWEGHSSDLAAFAAPLLQAGLGVLAVDLPAHGASSGRETSIPHSALLLRAMQRQVGPLHAVIAHSVGCAVLAEAMVAGFEVGRVAMIAAPASYGAYARNFAAAAGLDPAELPRLMNLLTRRIGIDPREVSLPQRATMLTQPALFVHSTDDRVVSVDDSLASAAAWRGARHQRVEGLGHRRILQDPTVVQAVIDFVTQRAPA